MKIHNVEQQTPEWFALRKGKVTASHATAIGNCGKGLDTYIRETVAKYFSSGEEEQFSNSHTERGNELEAQARQVYELKEGVSVTQVGFVELNDYVGCSPDGLIDELPGGLEIKCPSDKEYFNILMDGEGAISSDYLWQCQMNMLILEKDWWDLVYYNPNYKRSMTIFRLFPDRAKQESLEKGFAIAEEGIKKLKEKYEENIL